MRTAHGDAEGTRALIEVLLLHRSMAHDRVVAGIAAALAAGALTADAVAVAVAVEARRAAQIDSATPQPGPVPAQPQVTSLTQRRLAALPKDDRPLPSVSAYDQLLRRRPPITSEGELSS